MRGRAALVADRGHLPFEIEFRAVLPVVDDLAGEVFARFETLPQPVQDGAIGARSLQDARCFPEHLLYGVARHPRVGRIDEDDLRPRQVELSIGDHDGLPGLLHGGPEQSQRLFHRLPSGDVLAQGAIGLLQLQRLLLQLAHQHFAIEFELIVFVLLRRARLGRGRRHCIGHDYADPGEEVIRFGRLEEKSIGPETQGEPLVFHVRVGGSVDDEGHFAQPSIPLPVAQEGVTVHHRHEQIGDDDIGG